MLSEALIGKQIGSKGVTCLLFISLAFANAFNGEQYTVPT